MQELLSGLSKLFIIFILGGAVSGCGNHKSDGIQKFQLPWASENGVYALREIEIRTLTDLNSVSGLAAFIQVNPALTESQEFTGDKAAAHYIVTSGGLVIPSDFLTLQMLAVYAHTERLWYLDYRTGVNDRLSRPRRVAVAMNIKQDDPHRTVMINNALYYSPSDATIFVPYQLSQVPITLNGGLIAHEHFHAIFNAFVTNEIMPIRTPSYGSTEEGEEFGDGTLAEGTEDRRARSPSDDRSVAKDTDSYRQAYNVMIVRALNEGLADFWGWVYSGDEKFIGDSLPAVFQTRRLDIKPDSLKPLLQSAFRRELLRTADLKEAVGHAYKMSAFYSRLLVQWSKVTSQRTAKSMDEIKSDFRVAPGIREAVASDLIGALPAINEEILSAIKNKKYISPNILFSSMFKKELQVKATPLQCQYLRGIAIYNPGDATGAELVACDKISSNGGGIR